MVATLSESSDEERANIVAHTEDEYRLPNLAGIMPPEHLHPIVKLVLAGQLRNVTIYRGVPAGVTEIRPGDWVALTRNVAANHTRGADGQVISRRVPARDVAWAGTDENEYYYVPVQSAT